LETLGKKNPKLMKTTKRKFGTCMTNKYDNCIPKKETQEMRLIIKEEAS
jgi:hypothetical protein